MNEYDSNRIFDITKRLTTFLQKKTEADCYIINTCHIREKATEKVFMTLEELKKNIKIKKPILIMLAALLRLKAI